MVGIAAIRNMTHETTHDASTASDKGVSNEELTDAIEELEYRLCRLEYELDIEEEDGGGDGLLRDLVKLWRVQQKGYPNNIEGRAAAAAVRCCADELEAALNGEDCFSGHTGIEIDGAVTEMEARR